MTTYDRHQAILKRLSEHSSLKVVDLARDLAVSEGTIRNDLTALEAQSLLKRVRGGAIPANGQLTYPPLTYPLEQGRASINAVQKKRIARWAAELVNDGDVILLDASSTVLHMVPFLQERRKLTVVTNRIEIAQLLVRDTTKTVILVGGIVRADGAAVQGSISQDVLKDLSIGTAFVSSVACSLSSGLMESDIAEVSYKRQVVDSAAHVVALLDSSKFGGNGLKPFAGFEQIDHIVTDDGISREIVAQLKTANVSLTVCGEHAIQSLNPHRAAEPHYKIGFANLSEKVAFAVDVRRGLERAVNAFSNVDLIVADNNLSSAKALQIADEFIEQKVDLVIEYQIDETTGTILMNRFRENKIPVIAVDIPMVGATFFGVDNFQAGLMAGTGLGTWIQKNWQGTVDAVIILEERRAGPLPAARIQGQLRGLEQIIGPVERGKRYVRDSGNTTEKSYEQTITTLKELSPGTKVAVLSFNDDAALGALKALQECGWTDNAAIVGQGADRRIRAELSRQNPMVVGSTSFNPEAYGEQIMKLALSILRGEPIPPAVHIEHTFVDVSSLNK